MDKSHYTVSGHSRDKREGERRGKKERGEMGRITTLDTCKYIFKV